MLWRSVWLIGAKHRAPNMSAPACGEMKATSISGRRPKKQASARFIGRIARVPVFRCPPSPAVLGARVGPTNWRLHLADAVFCDFDNAGWLDLVVLNRSESMNQPARGFYLGIRAACL